MSRHISWWSIICEVGCVKGGLPLSQRTFRGPCKLQSFWLADREDKYTAFLGEVSERTGKLVAAWQTVGFVHGVLNTDNMSILGETIDYG